MPKPRRPKPAELSTAERPKAPGRPFAKGVSGNPGGQSKEKRAFLDKLRGDDADEVYAALMDGVKAREWAVVLKAAEWIAGKPSAAPEDRGSVAEALRVIINRQGGE